MDRRTAVAHRLGLLCVSLLGTVGYAQTPQGPRAPATPAAETDRFAAIQHVELAGHGAVWVGFAAQLRERVEGWRNFNFGALPPAPAGVSASDAFALTRALLSADVHAGRNVRFFAQAKSALSTRRSLAGGRRPSDVDELDVHQLFAELATAKRGPSGGVFVLRGGRLELAYGRERLVSALDWANTKRSFDGVTAAFTRGSGGAKGAAAITAFWARPVVVIPYRADRRDPTTSLFGVYGTMQPGRLGVGADLYWIGQARDSGTIVWNGTAGQERRHTLGLRMWVPTRGRSAVDLEGETAVQFGSMGSNDIRAFMFAGQAGYVFRQVKRSPRAYVNVDYASGDPSPGGNVGTFSQLNPQPHPFLGFADIAGRQNIVDLSGGASLQLWRAVSGAADYHYFRRASVRDAFYALPGFVARPAGYGSSPSIASEVDLSVRWPVSAHRLLLAGWSHVFPGAFITEGGRASGADSPIDFLYLMAQYTM